MRREIIEFTTEKAWLENRCKDLTSSDIASLFGCGYSSYEELVETKRAGVIRVIEQNERMKWGKALEQGIAEEFARQNRWTIRRKTEYIRIPGLRLGSSFDYELIDSNEDRGTNGLIEVKNVDSLAYKRDWKQGFEIEAPLKIELQIQSELLVSGFTYGYIAACVGGNTGVCLFRESSKKVHDAILIKAEKFWKDVGK